MVPSTNRTNPSGVLHELLAIVVSLNCFQHFPPVLMETGKCTHHHHYHQSLNREGCWGTTDDFATSFLHFPCSPLPSWTCRTLGLSISWCCLHTSTSVCLVFLPLSLCLARWFWPDPMNGKHDHTTAVCVSVWSSGGLCVVQLPAGSWHILPCW